MAVERTVLNQKNKTKKQNKKTDFFSISSSQVSVNTLNFPCDIL